MNLFKFRGHLSSSSPHEIDLNCPHVESSITKKAVPQFILHMILLGWSVTLFCIDLSWSFSLSDELIYEGSKKGNAKDKNQFALSKNV